MVPRWPKIVLDGLREFQGGPRETPGRPRVAPRWPKRAPRWLSGGFRRVFKCVKRAQEEEKIAQDGVRSTKLKGNESNYKNYKKPKENQRF